jgi:hypothetical protein
VLALGKDDDAILLLVGVDFERGEDTASECIQVLGGVGLGVYFDFKRGPRLVVRSGGLRMLLDIAWSGCIRTLRSWTASNSGFWFAGTGLGTRSRCLPLPLTLVDSIRTPRIA